MADYRLTNGGVIRESDGATIPATMQNSDWRKYQEWVEGGGVADPAPPAPPVLSDEAMVEARAAVDPAITERALINEICDEAKAVEIA